MDSSGVSQRIFAFSGNDGTAGASAVVAQINMNFTGLVRVHVGLGSVGKRPPERGIFTPAPSTTITSARLRTRVSFSCAVRGPDNTEPFHYWIGFTAYPVMNATPTGSRLHAAPRRGSGLCPYTEIFNPNINLGGAGHHDLLISGLMGAGTNG